MRNNILLVMSAMSSVRLKSKKIKKRKEIVSDKFAILKKKKSNL